MHDMCVIQHRSIVTCASQSSSTSDIQHYSTSPTTSQSTRADVCLISAKRFGTFQYRDCYCVHKPGELHWCLSMSVYLSDCQCICPCNCLCVLVSVRHSVCLCVCLAGWLAVCLSVCHCISVCLFVSSITLTTLEMNCMLQSSIGNYA
jgi:hypothetical protein